MRGQRSFLVYGQNYLYPVAVKVYKFVYVLCITYKNLYIKNATNMYFFDYYFESCYTVPFSLISYDFLVVDVMKTKSCYYLEVKAGIL